MDEEFHVRIMKLEDISAVYDLECKCFSVPWSIDSFMQEVEVNKLAHYYVGVENGEVVAYGGYWLVVDEAHITNIAVSPDCRRRGYGKRLVEIMLDRAKLDGARSITLEVRESNEAARMLYRSFGFKDAGVRPGYYQDPKEDAILMWYKPEDGKGSV